VSSCRSVASRLNHLSPPDQTQPPLSSTRLLRVFETCALSRDDAEQYDDRGEGRGDREALVHQQHRPDEGEQRLCELQLTGLRDPDDPHPAVDRAVRELL